MNEEKRLKLVHSKRTNFRELIIEDYHIALRMLRNFNDIHIELDPNENFVVSVCLNTIEEIIFFFWLMNNYLKNDKVYYI